jgi:hypothetical protein
MEGNSILRWESPNFPLEFSKGCLLGLITVIRKSAEYR